MVTPGRGPRTVAAALLVALLAGALTSFAQTVLPDGLAPLANSASSWLLLAAALGLAARTWPGAIGTTAGSLVLLVAGYYATASLRGFAVGAVFLVFWFVCAAVVGPVVGTATWWLREAATWRRAVAAAALGTVPVGEGAYGLTVVADSTPQGYWVGQVVVGLVLWGVLVARRVRRPVPVLVSAVLLTVGAAAFWVAYQLPGGGISS